VCCALTRSGNAPYAGTKLLEPIPVVLGPHVQTTSKLARGLEAEPEKVHQHD
jgi:hypothetical protein